MIAELAAGHRDAADVLLLLAAAVAGIAAFVRWSEKTLGPALASVAVGLLAVALLVE